jgi:L-ascorbate metabolism protein UlaG (beta-lactamase superfamily)
MKALSGGLTVTYIAHAGFLLMDGNKKVLVDALTLPPTRWKYDAPSAELREKMEKGQPPFDGVDLLLVSHAHGDHYGPPPVVNFLLNNPKAVLLTTPEVRDLAQKWIPDFKKVAERVIVPELEWKQSATREINGIRVEVARLKHGNDRDWPGIVYSFMLDLGGKKLLYAAATGGYFPEEYQQLGWAKRGIDLAFLCADDLMVRFDEKNSSASVSGEGIRMVRDLIAPKTTVMMHVSSDRLPAVERVLPQLQKEIPGLVLFRQALESRTF